MFIVIQPGQYEQNSVLLDQIFRLRKSVFHDRMKWKVPVSGDWERDEYDNASPTYLVWCNDSRNVVFGAVRLMSTMGPTLLHDVFHATHKRDPLLVGPDVWEATRMCIDCEGIARHFGEMSVAEAFNMMLVALCDCAMRLGVSKLVSNFEPYMRRFYRQSGAEMTFHGQADGYGERPVCCAAFEISGRILDRMRAITGVQGRALCSVDNEMPAFAA